MISKKTRKKVFDMAEQLGYRSNNFARNLRGQKTGMIGVIIPRINSYFMSSVISGIEEVVNGAGYTLIISQSSESMSREVANAKAMLNNRVDGLLVSLAYDTTGTKHFDMFIKKNIPVVFFDRVANDGKCTNVIIDNRKAAYEATKHLIDEGCKRVAHITAPSKSNVYAERLAGYKQALLENRVDFEESLLVYNNLSQEAGLEAATLILAMQNRPDGIFVSNDNCAVGCLIALKKAGVQIPKDIAIAGFNNDVMATIVEPNLTTVNYSGFEIGAVAARNLVNHLNGTANIDYTNTIVLRSELVIRASSKKSAFM
jgi:LacI family transcriptional regulator